MAQELTQFTTITDLAPATYQSVGQNNTELATLGIPLSHYLWVLKRGAKKIAAFIALSLLLTFLISSKIKPIYEATATINIDRQAPTGLIGDEAKGGSAGAGDADQFIGTQIKIIQSDAVLRPVAQKFDLLVREHQIDKLSKSHAQAFKDGPTELKRLKVIRPPNTYLLRVNYRSTDPQLSAGVANAIAKSYLGHVYRLQISSSMSAAGFMEKQLDELKAKMERSGQALVQFEKELNVVNPEEKTNIVSQRLLQLNTEYTSAQADRVRKQSIFESLQAGTLAAEQISGHGEDLQRLQDKMNEASARFAQVKETKGSNHPDYRRIQSELNEISAQHAVAQQQIAQRIQVDYQQAQNRERMLQRAVAEAKLELDKINARSVEYQRLKQEADADRKLYDELVTKIREEGINSGFQNKNIAIADIARPPSDPIFPKLKINLAVAGILALVLSIGVILLIDSFDTTVRDPEEVHRLFNTELIGMLPVVKNPKTLMLADPRGSKEPAAPVAPGAYGNRSFSSFEEAIRMLRNSLLLGEFDRRSRSILFTSATPGEGKSTTALHLAIAHAEQGKRTLIIDADLRRPTLQKKLGVDTPVGLSDVLTGDIRWTAAVMEVPAVPNLAFLPAGSVSRRAADLIGSGMADLLDETCKNYDLTIIDAPPLLGFAEPMQLATTADGVVVVAVAGETNRKAIGAVIATLHRLRANIVGVVLNRVTKQAVGSYYYYYSQYDKHYQDGVHSKA